MNCADADGAGAHHVSGRRWEPRSAVHARSSAGRDVTGDRGQMVADQLALAGVVAVGVGWVVVSEPAALAAGCVGDEGSFRASCDVGPGIAEGAVSVAASDVAVVDVDHVISPCADATSMETLTIAVTRGKRSGTDR